MTSKEQRTMFRDRLIQFANDLGYDVELDSPMEDHKERYGEMLRYGLETEQITQEQYDEHINDESRPAGDCSYVERRIRVREGKGLNGQIATLVHELCHAILFGSHSLFSILGAEYNELACESITEFVTLAVGVDRTEKTSKRIIGYGFGGYLLSPVTATVTRIILENIGIDPTTWGPQNVSTS